MNTRLLTCMTALMCVALVMLTAGSGALADRLGSASEAEGALLVTAARPQPAQAPAVRADGPPDTKALLERVKALEKENLVLREDLGKARLDARVELEAAARRQAEALEKLNAELADVRVRMERERAAQTRRNRNLWMAVGALAIGVAASN